MSDTPIRRRTFPRAYEEPRVGWMGAMMVGGQLIGSAIWTGMTATTSLIATWIVIAVVVGILQEISTFFLPNIKPGQELEAIAD